MLASRCGSLGSLQQHDDDHFERKSFHNYYDQIKVIVPWDMMESNLRSEFSTAKIQLTMKFSRVITENDVMLNKE